MGKYYEAFKKKQEEEKEEELERWNRENPDISPVGNQWKQDKKSLLEEFLGGYLQKGALDDDGGMGKNIAKTILGTAFDIADDAKDSLLNMGETAIDAGATAIGNILTGESREKVSNFVKRDLVSEFSSDSNILSRLPGGVNPEEINRSFGITNDDIWQGVERNSVLGEKSDALVQSATQLGATIGLQGIGVPWWMTTGVTSFGSGAEEALNESEATTIGEATGYGLVRAAADTLTEKLSGGINFGSKTLFGDGVKDTLTKKITNKALKTVAKYGVDIAGEGVEEVVAEAIGNAGKSIYQDDKTARELIFNEDAFEQYLDAFIGGALISGGMNAKRAVKSVKNGRDYDTGLSANEEAVVKKEIGNRTEKLRKEAAVTAEVNRQVEELAKTANLSDAEKRNIEKSVREQLDNGELDFSTTELSKKELAEIEEQVTEDLRKGYIDIDTIESTLAEGRLAQIRELTEQRDNSSNEKQKAEIQKEIDQLTNEKNKEMKSLVAKDYILQESYRQEVLKGESFTRDKSDSDTDVTKELEESAKAAGMNNTRKMHELFDYTSKIANDTDTKYGFINSKQLKSMGYDMKDATINGMVRVQEDGSTKVLINVDSNKALNTIIGHETTHLFERTKEHQDLVEAVKEYAQMKGDYDGRIKSVQELYKGVENANVENEVTADLVGEYIFTDEQFVMNLTKKPNVFQKVYDYVKHAYKMATAGSAEERKLLQAKRMFEKAYRNLPKQSNGNDNKYLVTKDDKGQDVVVINQNIYDGMLDADKPHEYIAEYIATEVGNSYRILESGESVYIGEDLPSEFTQSKYTEKLKNTRRDLLYAKNQTPQEFKDLIEIATDGKWEPNRKSKHNLDAKYGFYRYTTRFVIDKGKGRGPEYKANLLIRCDSDGKKYLYDIMDIKKVGTLHLTSTSQRSHGYDGGQTPPQGTPTNNSLLQSSVKGNTKLSISDNRGRELSAEQQEYFKDSKARDENDALKTVYHGTNKAGFTVFNRNQNWYTDSKEIADTYTNKDGVYEGYLNITNPLIIDANGEKWSRLDVDQIDPAVRDLFEEFGVSTFEEDGADRTSTADIVGVVEDGIDEGIFSYDGIIFENIYDEGMFGNVPAGTIKSNVYVTFNSNQFKNVDNENPTADADIRYSLSEKGTMVDNNGNDVFFQTSEEGSHGTLMAIRNIGENELRGMMELGGIPVPSIAITDPSKVDHSDFGGISLLFGKETIDPANKNNEVYDRDIWSSRFPTVEYEINSSVERDINAKMSRIYEQIPYEYQSGARRLVGDLEDMLNRKKGEASIIEEFSNDYDLKQAYLADQGIEPVEMIYKETVSEISEIDKVQNEFLLNAMSEEAVDASSGKGREWVEKYGDEARNALSKFYQSEGLSKAAADAVVENLKGLPLISEIRKARRYKENGGREVKREPDRTATNAQIDTLVNQEEYTAWLKNLFSGIELSKGIRNDKDYLTPSGNRRSFKQLHDDYTLNNIVKNMTKGRTQGSEDTMFGISAGAISANMAKRFNSIEELKASEGRIDAEADATVKNLTDELGDSIDALKPYWNGYSHNAYDAIAGAVFEFSKKKKLTEEGFRKVLKDYAIDENSISSEELQRVIRSLKNLTDIPSDYFEAKPQRAVGLDEIQAIIIPNDTAVGLKQELADRGFHVIEYDPNVKGDRQNKVNQFDELKFSLSRIGEDIAPIANEYNQLLPAGSYEVYGRDVKQRSSFDDIAPIGPAAEKTSGTDDIAPVRNITPLSDEEVAAFEPEAIPSVADEDIPIVDYDGTTTPMDTESLKLLARNMRKSLGLNNTQVSLLRNVIQDYSTGKIPSEQELFNRIADQFGVQTYETKNEEVASVKKALRETKIKVSDEIKDGITDYFKFRQNNFGKLKLANEGLAVDDFYEALKEVYPGYFTDDIINPTDQLLRMEEVANYDSTVKEEYALPDEKLNEVTEYIRESVSDYKRGAKLKDSLKRRGYEKKTRADIHAEYVNGIKADFAKKGFDLDAVLNNAKNLSTFASVDNTPQRYMEKTFGYKEGRALADATVNKAAENESKAIRWLNSFTNKKTGTLAQLSKKYNIKPFSKEDAAAQKYAEGMHVNEYGDYVEYGDRELEKDIKDPEMRKKIKEFTRDPLLRKIYDDTLSAINDSRTRNGYEAIPRRNDYFLHFREMDDTFSRIGIPFNPNDIRAKDLPTDINGMTADNKPGQPWFGSQMQRKGVGTTYSLLGGMERYLRSAKAQIYHIDDIQVTRALRNYVADTYGQAKGLESLDQMSDEEAEARIQQVFGSHLSTFAKFLNEQANIMAGKTALIDRGLEGVVGRRAITFMNTLNSQAAKNMIGFNLSSSLTNFVSVTQALAKGSKYDALKAFTQTVSNKVGRVFGKGDNFTEQNDAIVRRRGEDKFYQKPWEKVADSGFVFMSAIDDISTEFIVRTKFNELTRKGMSEKQAHDEAGKWAMRILGDRSFAQQPQIFNSKTLGLITKFQLEVRNQLDSMFYDTVQEANASTEEIQDKTRRNAAKAAKITSTVVQLAALQHVFGKAFESVAGYNPTFDIIENLMILFGFDDDEDSEDTAGDNFWQFVQGVGEDLPYVSTLTGGRIPIQSVLPIEQLYNGTDDYGNEKSRLETLKETLPYYLLPTGYGQIKKTTQGLSMFDDDLPLPGSYTDKGELRFPVEETPQNVLQAFLFGQWANENAQEYFDREETALEEKQIQELKELDVPIADYWDIRDGMKGLSKAGQKVDYIADLDLPISKKNILANNALNRDEPVDLSNYNDFSSWEEFDYSVKNPDTYPLAKVVGGVDAYKRYTKKISSFRADKDENGESISGTAKQKKIDYINGLDVDYGTKLLLFRYAFDDDDTYNYEIVDYVSSLNLSEDEKASIFTKLKIKVD